MWHEQIMITDNSTCATSKLSFGNANFLWFSVPVEELINMAAEKEDCIFNVFETSQNSKSLPKRDPRSIQIVIKNKISHFDKIVNIRYTESGSIVINTTDATCATEACKIFNFLDVAVSTRVIWKSITPFLSF